MPVPAAYTPSLPGLTGADYENLDTIINWGLGADSTAYLARMLTDPAAFGIDLARTAVLYMATGSEWPETRRPPPCPSTSPLSLEGPVMRAAMPISAALPALVSCRAVSGHAVRC